MASCCSNEDELGLIRGYMSQKVRVRFAPSPTGNMHIGGLRTALFNWLFARHASGTFLIRIEDTDKERSEEKYVQALLDALAWVGIESDEKIIFQSQRQDAYHAVLNKLVTEKKAYRCFCTAEDLEKRIRATGNTEEHYGYDGFCRDLPINHDEQRFFGVRFRIPSELASIEVTDLIRGTVIFERNQLDDFIIFRSDGTPMYNFAVVVDDHYSAITHIIRGEEHLSNTPKQILLYQACGFSVPHFAHIPMILAPDGSKLSKRHGATDVLAYKKQGYLPDALINYIVRLGWSNGDQEIFTKNQMIAQFTLEGVGKKAAIFDVQKLDWMNGVYIREKNAEHLYDLIQQTEMATIFMLQSSGYTKQQLLDAIRLYQPRVKNLVELVHEIMKLWQEPTEYNQEDVKKWITPESAVLFTKACQLLEGCEPFDLSTVTLILKSLCEQESVKFPTLAQPIRIALTGGTTSPGVFEMLVLLGKEKSVMRLKALQVQINF